MPPTKTRRISKKALLTFTPSYFSTFAPLVFVCPRLRLTLSPSAAADSGSWTLL